MKKVLFAVLCIGAITGCQPANISSVMRGSDGANSSMETRCAKADLRDESELANTLSKYDGWRLIFTSEFTTSNLTGTSGLFCFERPKK